MFRSREHEEAVWAYKFPFALRSLKDRRGCLKGARWRALALEAGYWRPGADYISSIVDAVKGLVKDWDVVVLSEKALSIAQGGLVDESLVKPSILSKLLIVLWMRFFWGYVLGPLSHLRMETLRNLRKYPVNEGASHKQVALKVAGPLQALRHYSEGGLDLSNSPFSYAVLPLSNPNMVAGKILKALKEATGCRLALMIVDSDKTYTFRNIHLTPLPHAIDGIKCFGGFLTFIIGRALKWRARATPVSLVGLTIPLDEALSIAQLAHKVRGHGAGLTVWDMANRFRVKPSEVTWEMLEKVRHKPIVIVRKVG